MLFYSFTGVFMNGVSFLEIVCYAGMSEAGGGGGGQGDHS